VCALNDHEEEVRAALLRKTPCCLRFAALHLRVWRARRSRSRRRSSMVDREAQFPEVGPHTSGRRRVEATAINLRDSATERLEAAHTPLRVS